MSTSISWVAIEGKSAGEVLKTFALAETGRQVLPGHCEISGGRLPNGWFVVIFNEFWHRKIHADWMSGISEDCVVVGCSESGNVNASMAFLYSAGRQVWRVSHVLDEGDEHFEAEGKPPRSANALLKEARTAARERHYDAVFSVPALLAQEACGFNHHEPGDLMLAELVAEPRLSGTRVLELIVPRLEAFLQALGFAKGWSGDVFTEYVAATELEEIKCCFRFSHFDEGGSFVNLDFKVRNYRVQALIRAALPQAEGEPELTYWDGMPASSGISTAIKTEDDAAAWMTIVESEVPRHIERLRRVKDLDTLVNDGRPRQTLLGDPTVSHYDHNTGFAKLVIACLAGNPAFERMVAETDAGTLGGPSPSNRVHRLASHLRMFARPKD
jgi:hypothetical protein